MKRSFQSVSIKRGQPTGWWWVLALRAGQGLVFALLAYVAIATFWGVPDDKAAYIGSWKGQGMSFSLGANSGVKYRRREGSSSRSLRAPFKRFEGDNIVAGLGPFSTTFVVTSPPRFDGADWRMTMDGVVLTKQEPSKR